MTRVRRRTTRSRVDVLTPSQWFELMTARHGPWKHFRSTADARDAWFAHRDELLDGLNDGPYSGHVRFPAGLERFEAPADLAAKAHALAEREDLDYRAAAEAAQAVWLVGSGLLDPEWIDTALSHVDTTPDDDWMYQVTRRGPYLAAALRTLLATDGPWKAPRLLDGTA